MLFFKKKPDARARLLKLCDEWREFETVELDRPHLESRLRGLCERLEQEAEGYKPVIAEAGSKGAADDVEFLFQVLAELPEGPGASRNECGVQNAECKVQSEDFTWDRAEKELGAVARVASGIRVPVQQAIRQAWQRRMTGRGGHSDAELATLRESERDELEQVDKAYRGYLNRLLRLHELHRAALEALKAVTNEDGVFSVKAALRSDDARFRRIAVKALKLRNWQPATVEEKLDFLIVPAKNPDTEVEAGKKIAALIAETASVKELLEVIEPRLAEEGLTELQARLLEQLCNLHSEQALDRLNAVMASSLEPASLKVKVCQSLPDIGTAGALKLLVAAMDELDMEVRTAAAGALGRIGAAWAARSLSDAEQQDLRAAQERLVFALRDGDVTVRDAAARSLRHFPQSRAGLVTALGSDRNPNAREYSALALESFEPDEASGQALLAALHDEDAAVRQAAARALKKQERVPEDPELRIRFLCASQSWKELVKTGPAATDNLKRLLRDRNEEVRLNVVEALGAVRARAAVKELGISLSDSNQDVRKEAAKALRLIGDPAALEALRIALPKEGFRDVKAEIERTIQKLEASGR
jgi:HEAT repeat protein